MGMICPSINLEFFIKLAPETIFGQHAPYRVTHQIFWSLFSQFLSGYCLDPAHVARVAIVGFLFPLPTGQFDLFSINNNDKIASIRMGCETGLMLAPQSASHLTGQSTQSPIGGIHHIPLAVFMIRLRKEKLRIEYITMLVDTCQEKLAQEFPQKYFCDIGHGEAANR
jgi:hypothetical protein